MSEWIGWFLFTQIVELPIYSWPLRGRVAVAFGASALTHPVVWFVFPRFGMDWTPMAVSAETFAVVVEALWLRAFGVKRALLWSLLGNAASFGLGLASHAFWGVP
jgi:hypothetical protein